MTATEKGYGVKDVMRAFILVKNYCPDYDPKTEYRRTKTSKVMEVSDRGHAIKVGNAYHLVEKMIERKAPKKDIARAVKYLWVTIDAVKFKLDYERAYEELDIAKLNAKYYPRVRVH